MGPSYGGPFESVRNLAIALSRAGHETEVRMPWSEEAYRHQPDWEPASVSVRGKISVSPLGWSAQYGRELLATEVDVMHTHGLWLHPSWAALSWKAKFDRPHVASIRGMLERWAWEHHAWKKRPVWWLLERRNLESAALLHATSDQEALSIRERGLRAPIAVIPNGVMLPEDWDAAAGRGKVEKKTLLFLGRVHPVKGLPLLLEAFAKVRPSGWDLKIVGPDEGGHRKELENQVSALGLESVVSFLDPVRGKEAKRALFDEASLFVLPTHSENFGIAVAEAMAHGLPVITTHGAPWQLLETERCGWWVPVSVEGIAAGIDAATRMDPDILLEMGTRGRAVVAERFGWDGIARRFVDCYRWLSGDGPRPDCVIS